MKSNKQVYVKILCSDDAYVTREASPNETWDADDISHNYTVDGFKIVNEKNGWDFVLDQTPKNSCYLVCAFYSTGDSFHREDNCISLVSFVKNIEDAEVIRKAIEKDYKQYNADQKWEIKPLTVHLPKVNKDEKIYTGDWKGYFERLSSVDVKCLSKI